MAKKTCTRYTFFSAIFLVSVVGYFLYDNTLLTFLFKRKPFNSGLTSQTNPLYTESREKSINDLKQVDLFQKQTKKLLKDILEFFMPLSPSLSFIQLFQEVSRFIQKVKDNNPSILYELDIDDLRIVKSKHFYDKDVDKSLMSVMGIPQMTNCNISPKSCLSVEKVNTIVRYTLDKVTALVNYLQRNQPSQSCDAQLMLLVLYVIITVKLQEIFQVNMAQLEFSINRLRYPLENDASFNEMSFQFQRIVSRFLKLTSFQFGKIESIFD